MGMDRRSFLIASALLPSMAWADLYDDYINSTSKQPFVSFLGRKSGPVGHAFVGLGVKLNANLFVYEYLFGLYPKEGKKLQLKMIFSQVTGDLRNYADAKDIFSDTKWDVELLKDLTAAQHTAVKKQMEIWKVSAPPYNLLANDGKNCNALVGSVATMVGMKDPGGAGTTLPWHYIEALKKANP